MGNEENKKEKEKKGTNILWLSRSSACLEAISFYPHINHIKKVLLFILYKWYNKTQRDLVTYPKSAIGKWQNWNLNPGVDNFREYTWFISRACSFRVPKDPHNFSKSPGFPNFPCPDYLCGESGQLPTGTTFPISD